MLAVSPTMMYLIKRSNLFVDTLNERVPFLQSAESYSQTFMGEDIVVDPLVQSKCGKEFYCTNQAVAGVMDALWEKYIADAQFYYCPVCSIMRAYFKGSSEAPLCCIEMKKIQSDIGLKFFELPSLMNTKEAVLHVPREELMVHLL